MKLSIADRLVVSQLYPQKSNLVDQILVKDIQKKVELNQQVIKDIDLKVMPNGNVSWNKDKEKDITVTFTDAELELLKNQINELDKKKEITPHLVDLCIKINNEKKEDK